LDEPPSNLFNLNQESNPLYLTLVLLACAGIYLLVTLSEHAIAWLTKDDLDRCKRRASRADLRLVRLNQQIISFSASVRLVQLLLFMVMAAGVYVAYPVHRVPLVVQILIIVVVVYLSMLSVSKLLSRFAVTSSLSVALRLGGIARVVHVALLPIARFYLNLQRWAEQLLVARSTSSGDEISMALKRANETTEVSEKEKELLQGIINFRKLTVQQVMHAREEIDAVDASLPFQGLLAAVGRSGFSRLPVYQRNLDNVLGVLYSKDLLPYMDLPSFNWHTLIRPAFRVQQLRKIDSLLKDFQEKHVHLALVVDDANHTVGIITLEDVIEEIIGDIQDESDVATV
jgi:CBS domain containing-hemolysin-like protein